jgi:hypothetical protein
MIYKTDRQEVSDPLRKNTQNTGKPEAWGHFEWCVWVHVGDGALDKHIEVKGGIFGKRAGSGGVRGVV